MGQWEWAFSSKKDPRFRGAGTSSGMYSCAADITRAIRALEEKLAVQAPDDIETQGNKS